MKTLKALTLFLLVILCALSPAQAEDGTEAGLYLWRLVNEARLDPLPVLANLGIEEGAARSSLGSEQWILDAGLPPLSWNSALGASAMGHGRDMIARVYYSYTSLDGRTVIDRMIAAGCEPLEYGETLGALFFSRFVEPLEAARVIFENWIRDELDPGRQGQRNIFNPDLTDFGVAFIGAQVHLGKDLPPNVYLAVADFASPVDGRPFVVGNVYEDPGGLRLFSPERGVAGLEVALIRASDGREILTTSTALGAYQVEAPSGVFLIEVRDATGVALSRKSGVGSGANTLIDLEITNN
jgi:Cysteine-rich secretory protein family